MSGGNDDTETSDSDCIAPDLGVPGSPERVTLYGSLEFAAESQPSPTTVKQPTESLVTASECNAIATVTIRRNIDNRIRVVAESGHRKHIFEDSVWDYEISDFSHLQERGFHVIIGPSSVTVSWGKQSPLSNNSKSGDDGAFVDK